MILVNIFFTYRWLLLECKREFPFNEALRVLEVMWATLPIASEPPQLSESSLIPFLSDNTSLRSERPLACRLLQRRALSCPQLSLVNEGDLRKARRHSSSFNYDNNNNNDEQLFDSLQQGSELISQNDQCKLDIFTNNNNSNSVLMRAREKSLENSFSLSEISEFDSNNLSTCSDSNAKAINTDSQSLSSSNWTQRLSFGDALCLEEDNAFLIFLCISILLAHRSHLLKQKHFDEQEISMHFDRYRRRHDAERLLTCARSLYSQYIQWARKRRMVDDLNRFSAS